MNHSSSLRTLMRILLTISFGTLIAVGAAAQVPSTPEERQKAFDEAMKAAVAGPKDIALAGQAVLHLPANRVYIPQPQATQMVHAMGNPGTYKTLQGLVFPKGEKDDWFALVEYEPSGYIKDDDARDWNADDMLKSYKEGTEASNEERVKMGVAPMEIIGWAEKPNYKADTHRLVWAMSSRHKGDAADANQGVNYNTFALGREGYISLNLVTDLKDLPTDKQAAQDLLAALEFDKGKQYADFNSSTDHVAEYGLATLVLGVGAKKLGLLALGFAFIAKFAKLAILAVAGVGVAIRKFFQRKSAP